MSLYEGIPTGKNKPKKESWAPKHEAVFGQTPTDKHEAVWSKADAELSLKEAAERRNSAPINDKVFPKVEAPSKESIDKAAEKSLNDSKEAHDKASREDFLELRGMLLDGSRSRALLTRLQVEGKLNRITFAAAMKVTLDLYDNLYQPLAPHLSEEKDEALHTSMESLRQILKDPKKLQENYDAYLAGMKDEKKAA